MSQRHPSIRLVARGLIVLVVIIVLLLGSKLWRAASYARSLAQNIQTLQTLATSRTSPDETPDARLDQLDATLATTHRNALALRGEVALFLPITSRLAWLPAYGPDLAAAGPLLDATMHFTEAAQDMVDMARTMLPQADALRAMNFSASTIAPLAEATPQLAQAHARLVQAQKALAPVAADHLSPRLRAPVERLTTLLPLLVDGTSVGIAANESLLALAPLVHQVQHTTTPTDALALVATLHAVRPQVAAAHQHVVAMQPPASSIPADAVPAAVRPYAHLIGNAQPVLSQTLALVLVSDDVAQALEPVLADTTTATAEMPTALLARQLVAARPHLRQMHTLLDALATQTDDLLRTADSLPPELVPQLHQARATYATQLRPMLDLALIAPEILGTPHPRDYLLIALNPDELRGSGGLISAIGELRIEQGALNDFLMQDSGFVGRQRLVEGPYVTSPEPLQRYMGLMQWTFPDAMWSPDFPTAARSALLLYNLGHHAMQTQAIAFDTTLLRMLLEATGPVPVAGADTLVSAANVETYMRESYDTIRSSNAFVGTLSQALVQKIESGTVEPLALLTVLHRALDERHLLIMLARPSEAAVLAALGWDGAVQPPASGDFLLVVDSNVGYNKANANITQTLAYTADLRLPTTPQATLTLSYTHNGQPSDTCHHFDYDRATNTYTNQEARCYWSYLRVLAPRGSHLLNATRLPTPATWLITDEPESGDPRVRSAEAGVTEMNTFFVVPSGEQRTVSLRYALPAGVLTRDAAGNWQYALHIQKQAGREAVPVLVSVQVPPGATLVATSRQPLERHGDTLTFALSLATDQSLAVTFQER